MLNFQGIIFIQTRTYRGILKSALEIGPIYITSFERCFMAYFTNMYFANSLDYAMLK